MVQTDLSPVSNHKSATKLHSGHDDEEFDIPTTKKPVDKHQLEKKVRKFKEIKNHPKLRNASQLLGHSDEEKKSSGRKKKTNVKKLHSTPRKKYEKRSVYDLDGVEAGHTLDDEEGPKRIPMSRLQKIDRIIEGTLPPPKKEKSILAENAKLMRDRQGILGRLRPTEIDDSVYRGVLK